MDLSFFLMSFNICSSRSSPWLAAEGVVVDTLSLNMTPIEFIRSINYWKKLQSVKPSASDSSESIFSQLSTRF